MFLLQILRLLLSQHNPLTSSGTGLRRFPSHILPHVLQSKTAQFSAGKHALAAVLKGHGAVAVVVPAVNAGSDRRRDNSHEANR